MDFQDSSCPGKMPISFTICTDSSLMLRSYIGFLATGDNQLTAREKRSLRRTIVDALGKRMCETMTASEFYDSIGVSLGSVHKLIDSQLCHPRFFPKREPRDAQFGQFNVFLANEMDSNFDIQPVMSGTQMIYYLAKNEPSQYDEAVDEGRHPCTSNPEASVEEVTMEQFARRKVDDELNGRRISLYEACCFNQGHDIVRLRNAPVSGSTVELADNIFPVHSNLEGLPMNSTDIHMVTNHMFYS